MGRNYLHDGYDVLIRKIVEHGHRIVWIIVIVLCLNLHSPFGQNFTVLHQWAMQNNSVLGFLNRIQNIK